ncbi:MAG: universal stress protein [Comamonas sp.]|uniref:universal stress protein n=1 Tax=Comamonas sp. BIGb0152 TaxID=2940601 RepID=UPI002167D896|nr:universal stress protein [Comamonas sp. BIGb0152]MCS4291888.1 nucleotide-binding universal stress UspA family protein [Comamonas sp. BIGb0152]
MYQHILLATDGSALSEKAVQHALALAKLSHAQVTAVNISPNYPRSYFEGSTMQNPDDIARIEQGWERAAQGVVDKVVAEGAAAGVPIKTLVIKSDLIAEALLETAQKENCDLIVMASHGYRGLKRLLLGSETQHVLTHATIPVLVLR